jgi:atypical dual specificity phosphatase
MTELDISEITSYLYVSSFPGREHVEQIRGLGVRLILSMYLRKPDKILGESPTKLLWMPVIDSPITPIPLSVFQRGVQAALPVIDDGGKVLVHCKWGIHRSAGMACCVLIGKGYTLDEAIQLVKRKRAVAKPDDGHILARITKFEQDWIRRSQKTSTPPR